LLIGRSQLVLDDTVSGLRAHGYTADATNDFVDVTARFDVRSIDLVVFGGQVPPEQKDELRKEIGALNPRVVFIQGLAGIPGLLIEQVEAGFRAEQDPTSAPTYTADERLIRLSLPDPADVTATAWWQTSFVPPDPKSDSLLLLDERLTAGDHAIRVPDHIPDQAAFATVHIDGAIYAFSIGPRSLDRWGPMTWRSVEFVHPARSAFRRSSLLADDFEAHEQSLMQPKSLSTHTER
jgi:hypothetical protein